MKSAIAILTLACAASAASIPDALLPRDALAICNAKKGESCPGAGVFACENNGGHSMFCSESSRGKFNWIYADNCPDSKKHCDCATGKCVPN
ncbi:hypothetical protein P171DRAFT_423044 [Karstenula rhodostoma CBS 690.94]|uniref:Uncharacterized protein n=1 Tax=Karstenula rhodostoma CBS 690.94 TaxID=1392251 RepID=A0A9P4U6E8_9PLEO|nr:hypothetical protein P171DRAFT_423044 [Karstenula rhodostoma CBS 690.94]